MMIFFGRTKEGCQNRNKRAAKEERKYGKILMLRGRQKNFSTNKIIANLQYCRVESLADILSSQGSQWDEKGCNG